MNAITRLVNEVKEDSSCTVARQGKLAYFSLYIE